MEISLAACRWTPRPSEVHRWIALGFAVEPTVGIAMVHAKEGWFVVGGGRNGAEYSVLLIGIMLAVAWAQPRGAAAAFDPATSTA